MTREELSGVNSDRLEIDIIFNDREDVVPFVFEDAEGVAEGVCAKTTFFSSAHESSLKTVVEEPDDFLNSEVELLLDEHVLAGECAVADKGVVCAGDDDSACIEELADGVVGHALDGLCVEVACGAAFDDDPVGDDVLEEGGVLAEADAVANSVCHSSG